MSLKETGTLTGKFAVIRHYSEYYSPEMHRAGEIVFVGKKDKLSTLYYCRFLDGSERPYDPDELTVIADERVQWWLQAQFDKLAMQDK